MEVFEHIAYLTAPDGTKIQVLNEAQDDWNEQATKEAYDAYIASLPPKKFLGLF